MNLGYVISTIIAGIILLSLVGLNSRIVRSSGEQTLYTMAKIDSDMVVDYVKDDMRSMGYGIESTAIEIADSSHIRFLVNFDTSPDTTTIEWRFDVDATPTGRNPNVRPLYRSVNGGDEVSIGAGIVRFQLEYLDSQRQVIPNPETQLDAIRQIRLEVMAESLESYDVNRFERSTWTGEITPFNLN